MYFHSILRSLLQAAAALTICVADARGQIPVNPPSEIPRYVNFAADASPIEKWLEETLDRPVQRLHFPGDTPLNEILDAIATHFTSTYGGDDGQSGTDFKMIIYPDAGELSLERVEESLEGITISDIDFDGISLRNALKLIFEQTYDDSKSPVPLTYVIQNEVMMITTLDKAESAEMLTTRVYNVAHLLRDGRSEVKITVPDPPLVGGRSGQGPTIPCPTCSYDTQPRLIELIVHMTFNSDCNNWSRCVGGTGSTGEARLYGDRLIVRQTPDVHRQIVRLLNQLGRTK